MSEIKDDIHDQLTKAYMEYFKENEKFEVRNSIRTHRSARNWLREIRRLARLRAIEINEQFKAKKEANKK